MAQVLILMATYNGAKYLAQQMDSILAQSMPDWRLLVRDDGSTDGTVAMLEEYRARDARIQLLQNKDGEHGAFVNFHELIRIAKASDEVYPYYAFSDQDDVWLPSKLERHLERVREQEKMSPGKPVFLYGDFCTVDSNGKVIETRHGARADMCLRSDWDLLIALGRVWGCASMFNRALMELVPESSELNKRVVMHDNYMAAYARIYGECIYDRETLLLHRLHGENVTGSMPSSDSVLKTFSKFFALDKSHRGLAMVLTHGVNTLEEMIAFDPDRRSLSRARTYIENGGLRLVFFCLREKVYRFRWDKTLALYLLMLMGGYRKYLIRP